MKKIPHQKQIGSIRSFFTAKSFYASVLAGGILCFTIVSATAQTTWIGGNGTWDPSNSAVWSGGVPTVSTEAKFTDNGTINLAGDGSSNDLVAGSVTITAGKTLQFNLEDGVDLTLGATGEGLFTYGAGSQITFNGPSSGSATITYKGASLLANSSLTLKNHVSLINQGADTQFGNYNNNNVTLTVEDSASLTSAQNLIIGKESTGVRVFVKNGGTLNATGVSALLDGTANSIDVSDGGTVNFPRLYIGSDANSRKNIVTVKGENSSLVAAVQSQIGVVTGFGGNALIVDDGGRVKVTQLTINGFSENGGDNDGSNYLYIGKTGTYEIVGGTTALQVNGGLVQMEAGGVITGTWSDFTVKSQGRFEAAGSGMNWYSNSGHSAVGLKIESGGTLAVGLTGSVVADSLDLKVMSQLQTGSTLELGIYSGSTNDQLNFTDKKLLVGSGVHIKLTLQGYAPTAGDEWALLTGNTATQLISGDATNMSAAIFDTPALGNGLSWYFDDFNEAGGWKISVVPEPTSVMLILLSGFGLNLLFRRRRLC